MSTATMNGRKNGHEIIEGNYEVMESHRDNFAMSQAKGEVDVQIATAKRFPRSIKKFQVDAISLATLDEDTAASCSYTLPARKGGNGAPITGPSARLAEIVAACWGNMRAQACIVDDDGEFITAQGRAWDLEKNVAIAVDVRRRITDRNGNRFSADMINTTANAANSIALRNSVFKVVPFAMVKPIYDAARKVAIGDATTLAERRAKMVAHFGKMGVKPEQICAAVDKPSVEDITIDDLATLVGLSTAIKEGDTTVDEAFPAQQKEEKKPETTSASDKLAETIVKDKPVANPEHTAKWFMDAIEHVGDSKELSYLTKDLKAAIKAHTVSPQDGEDLASLFKIAEERFAK